jgi:hypothetical protein
MLTGAGGLSDDATRPPRRVEGLHTKQLWIGAVILNRALAFAT